MSGKVSVTVKGGQECKDKLRQVSNDLSGNPMVSTMRQATLIVMSDARKNAPVDQGILKASITPAVYSERNNIIGVVGSNKEYAPYQELGTGVFVGRRPHRPPAAALETWARRHGTTGAQVAFAIGKRGGLRPKRFLQRAYDDNKARIVALIESGVKDIVEK